jgi:hypothetical protein
MICLRNDTWRVSCVHDMSHVTQTQCNISILQDMYRWYGTHQPCLHNIHHVFTIWSSTVQDYEDMILYNKATSTWNVSCRHETIWCEHNLHVWHMIHIMSTCSPIAYHVNMISYSWTCQLDMLMCLTIHVMLTWSGNLKMNLVSGWHELLFHVNKKLFHVLKLIMLTWCVIMLRKGVFFWYSPSRGRSFWLFSSWAPRQPQCTAPQWCWMCWGSSCTRTKIKWIIWLIQIGTIWTIRVDHTKFFKWVLKLILLLHCRHFCDCLNYNLSWRLAKSFYYNRIKKKERVKGGKCHTRTMIHSEVD